MLSVARRGPVHATQPFYVNSPNPARHASATLPSPSEKAFRGEEGLAAQKMEHPGAPGPSAVYAGTSFVIRRLGIGTTSYSRRISYEPAPQHSFWAKAA
jgi:hypothetical protein